MNAVRAATIGKLRQWAGKAAQRQGAWSTRRMLYACLGLVSVAALVAGGPVHASTAAAPHVAAAAASSGTWGDAEEVPGIAALAADGSSYPLSLSCGAAGNCSAGGYYTTFVNEPGPQGAFIVSEKSGTWGTAAEVPGTAALNRGGLAQLASVSCPSAGNCSAGGYYTDGSGHQQAFVVGEANGTWGTAIEVPGFSALNQSVLGGLTSVSCASAGNCSAGGYYTDGSGRQQAFVVGEANGTWGTAKEVPGFSALNQGGGAQLTSVSCASAGNCSAGGTYQDGASHLQVFVVGEANGTWGTAKEVPGFSALNQGGAGNLDQVSCGAAGNCSAGGDYIDGSDHDQAFVVSEKSGTWGKAKEVPGTAALDKGAFGELTSVSCASAGNCSAGGGYIDGSGHDQAFVVSEKSGTWGKAKEVPGFPTLNKGRFAGLSSVSCASAGNCSAGGHYTNSSGKQQAFVLGEANGTWGTAKEVPGSAALNQGGNAVVDQVSCASAGHCSAAGTYRTSSGFDEAFVVNET